MTETLSPSSSARGSRPSFQIYMFGICVSEGCWRIRAICLPDAGQARRRCILRSRVRGCAVMALTEGAACVERRMLGACRVLFGFSSRCNLCRCAPLGTTLGLGGFSRVTEVEGRRVACTSSFFRMSISGRVSITYRVRTWGIRNRALNIGLGLPRSP